MRVVLAAVAILTTAGIASAEEIYRRADVLEDRLGRVRIRTAFETVLTTAEPCEPKRLCLETARFPEVVALEFAGERRRAGAPVVRTEEPAGTVYLALPFTQADLEAFHEELAGHLTDLSAEAFGRPFAGLQRNSAPFDSPTLARAERSTWACFRSGEETAVMRFVRTIEPPGEGSTATTNSVAMESNTYETPPSPLCDEVAATTDGLDAETIETLPQPVRLREIVVHHDDVVLLDASDPSSIRQRPAGAWFFKQAVPTGFHGSSQGGATGAGEMRGATLAATARDGWRWSGAAQASGLDEQMLDENVWLHRFTVETTERQLGTEPTAKLVDRVEISVAYLATVPAIPFDAPSEERGVSFDVPANLLERRVEATAPARIDRAAYSDGLAERLEGEQGSTAGRIEKYARSPGSGLASEGWLSVLCAADGTASYCVLPTNACAPVTNADAFCSAVAAAIDRGLRR